MTSHPLDTDRRLFPVGERYIYMNNAGVAPTSTAVRAAIDAWVGDLTVMGILNESGWEKAADDTRAAAECAGRHLDG